MFDRFVTPIIAIGLGFLVWLYIRGRDQETLQRPVPFEIGVAPAQLDAYEIDPATAVGTIPVEFTGPPSRIKEVKNLLQQGALRLQRTVTVPDDQLLEPRYEPRVRLDTKDVALPPGVNGVVDPSRNPVQVILRRTTSKQLPVRLKYDGNRLESHQFEPPVVTVRGPKEVLDKMAYADTVLFELPPGAADKDASQMTAMPKLQIRLANQFSGQPLSVTPPLVETRITIRPTQKTFELTDVPVGFLCPPNFPFRADFKSDRAKTITLKVTGPATAVKPTVKAYVDLTARPFSAGLQPDEPIKLVDLPPGYQVAQDPKQLRADIVLMPLDTPMKTPGAP